jgi:hypothetical protein
MTAVSRRRLWLLSTPLLALGLFGLLVRGHGTPAKADPDAEYATVVVPLVKKYCLACHSTKARKGGLDLQRFADVRAVRKDVKPWQQVVEQLEAGEMPPRKRPQPTPEERRRLVAWASRFLDAEARARTGDPGRVPLRRLSNVEYDCTVRDLTGVDLQPTREFPPDAAAGEGFTNAAEALSDVTPALLARYLAAAKEVARHAVLLPDGFRFSAGKTRRDWTDESTAKLRAFYQDYAPADGRLAVQPYLAATVRHREGLRAGTQTVEAVAGKEKLNPRYLAVLWRALTDGTPSYPLDAIRGRWRAATEQEVPALAGEIAAWQAALWKTYKIGSYVRPDGAGYAENLTRQVPGDPPAAESVTLRVALKPAPGQADVVLRLITAEATPAGGGHVVWHRPRFEAAGKPALLLRDYAAFGPAFEVDCPRAFAATARYLAAAVEAANNQAPTLDDLAAKHHLDAPFLRRWIEVLAVEHLREGGAAAPSAPAVPLELLAEKTPPDNSRPAVRGWRKGGTDLPVLVTNASDRVEHIPGRLSPHGVAVHPLPKEFVAVAWKSPAAGPVRVTWRVAHAHPACGNGVAWWLEQRRGGRAAVLGAGVLGLGQEARPPARTVKVEKGDQLVLAVDARDGDHACDLTELGLTVTEAGPPGRAWDLAADVADSAQAGNPHADRHGNHDTWSFARGPSGGGAPGKNAPLIPADSVLGRWREAAADPARQPEAAALAGRAEALLSGPHPTKAAAADRALYEKLVRPDSPLFAGVALARLAPPRSGGTGYGLPKERFGTHPGGRPVDGAGLVSPADSVPEVRLPAALFVGREFVVEGRLDGAPGDRVVQFRVRTTPAGPGPGRGGAVPVVASPTSAGYKRFLRGCADFRRVFPLFTCFPQVVPTDEVVSLKMFHREDEPLERLFLDGPARSRLERLWGEHRFISRQAVLEDAYLPQFIGFVTQDQPKAMVAHFEGQRPAFRKRADALLKEEEAAVPRQLDALLDFACRAYRRPLLECEKKDLRRLYEILRAKKAGHDEAFRGVLARVFLAPAFLFRVENAPPGAAPRPVDDWELASRLSYFLWSSLPDDELRRLAAAGRLGDPKVLEAQARRMLRDERLRALAVEFGTQWIHVRGLDQLKEKNEKLFPTFDARLRKDINEEAILFFQDLFQQDRAVTRILDADYAYLNENLARHYGVPGVRGPHWRRVEGVRKYGRGGILALAAVHARQSGASRTSPVLRGNWVVETLLGEKLPRPPANVPVLPDVAGGTDRLTTRQMVEKHVSVASCAACHVRIDPFGFAFEKYDPIGRLRETEGGGLPVDARSRLRDGTEFEGLDGLRAYLLAKKKGVIVRLFCRRLLGYALGRATTLADTSLIDRMVAELDRSEGRVSAAVLTIVRSPQFRMIRGREAADDD